MKQRSCRLKHERSILWGKYNVRFVAARAAVIIIHATGAMAVVILTMAAAAAEAADKGDEDAQEELQELG